MIKLMACRWLRNFSQRYQYDTAYMAAILEHSPSLLLKYSSLNLLAREPDADTLRHGGRPASAIGGMP